MPEAQTIFKYPLVFGELTQHTLIHLPVGAQILHYGVQSGSHYVWVKHVVQPERKTVVKEPRTVRIVGTGWEFLETKAYIGTVQVNGYVWHAFET